MNEIPTLEEFLKCCHKECAFLITEYGFQLLDSPREYNEYSVRYRKGELGVDVYGESWGQAASCDLARGEDQLYLGFMVPRGEHGKRKRKRVRPGQLEQIAIIASLLKQHASDFLRGDLTRFDVALAEWKRISAPRQLTDDERLERQVQKAAAEAGHASKRGDNAEVVRLLDPYEKRLTPHQRQMLDTARRNIGITDSTDG